MLHPTVEAALRPVALAAGDLLVLPSNLLHRIVAGGSVASFDFAHHSIAPEGGYLPHEEHAEPAWLAELSPLERRLVAGREFGQLAPTAPPSAHPSPMAVREPSEIEAAERWAWDRAGWLVVPGLMDKGWIGEATRSCCNTVLSPRSSL